MNTARKYNMLDKHKHNDYDVNILRNELEAIKNDPFDLGTHVKGLTDLNPQRSLSNYAEELVSSYGTYNYSSCEIDLSDIPYEEQNELIRLYIEASGRELTECVNGNDFSIENDYTCALLSMLQNDCKDTRERFAEVTPKNILTYYWKSLQETLDEACHTYLCNLNNEAGYYSDTDRETGDIHWSKF